MTLAGNSRPSAERHGDLGIAAALNDMVVGDHDALGADQHAGAERVLDALARNAEPLAEQPSEDGVVEEGRDHLLDPVPHIDIDHRRRRPLHHRREGLLHRHGAFGRRALLRGGGRGKDQQSKNGQYGRPAMFTR